MFIKICLAIIVCCQVYNVFRAILIYRMAQRVLSEVFPIVKKGLSVFVPDSSQQGVAQEEAQLLSRYDKAIRDQSH